MVKATELFNGKEFCPGYRLVRLLGRGGYGSVWEAQGDCQTVALKFLPCDEQIGSAREIRSIQAIRQLRHPALTRIHQLWGHRGYIVIVMERADTSVLDLLAGYQSKYGQPMVRRHACQILSQAAAGIDFLNTRQHLIGGRLVAFQHGDVKPSNMLVFGDKIKLSDFGLSSATTNSGKRTLPVGTAHYAAPEVLQGRVSTWTDQYALAITYCELRGSRLPFAGTAQPGESRPPLDLSMLTAAERPIIARALAMAPPERWPSCGAMMTRLRELPD
jgi:serine/threonine protein kinase